MGTTGLGIMAMPDHFLVFEQFSGDGSHLLAILDDKPTLQQAKTRMEEVKTARGLPRADRTFFIALKLKP